MSMSSRSPISESAPGITVACGAAGAPPGGVSTVLAGSAPRLSLKKKAHKG